MKILQTLLIFASFFLYLACGGSSGDSSGDSWKYSFSGTTTVPVADAQGLKEQTVTFTMRWSEDSATTISGMYQDDYFASSGVSLTGTINAQGERSFTVTLASAVGEVVSLVLTMPPTSAESLASGSITLSSFAGKTAADVVIFDRKDIVIKAVEAKAPSSQTPAGGHSAVREAAVAFFTKNKGTYEWYASNSNAKPETIEKFQDTTFEHGALYKVTVSDQAAGTPANAAKVWGSLVVERKDGSGEAKVYNFGDQDSDKFEAVAHEQYAIANRDNVSIGLQEVFESKTLFMQYSPNDQNRAYWNLSTSEPEAMVEPKTGLAKYGIEFITGEHTFKITTSKSNEDCKRTQGEEFTVSIDANGALTSKEFGDFSADQLSISSNSSLMTWCEKANDSTNFGCYQKSIPKLNLSGKNLKVSGGSYQLFDSDQTKYENCYFEVVD